MLGPTRRISDALARSTRSAGGRESVTNDLETEEMGSTSYEVRCDCATCAMCPCGLTATSHNDAAASPVLMTSAATTYKSGVLRKGLFCNGAYSAEPARHSAARTDRDPATGDGLLPPCTGLMSQNRHPAVTNRDHAPAGRPRRGQAPRPGTAGRSAANCHQAII
jgi:hypothetical protein